MKKVRVLDVIGMEEVHSHAVLLCDEQNRVLPIFVGPAEAISTAMSLKWGHIERPLTYKLMANLIHTLGAKVEEVCVEKVTLGTIYASIKLRKGEEVKSIDSRPSDAIALSITTGAPIYVAEEVMKKCEQYQKDFGKSERKIKGADMILREIEEQLKKAALSGESHEEYKRALAQHITSLLNDKPE